MSDFQAKAAIREVLSGYSGAASRLDIEEFITFFHPDALFYGVPEMAGLPAPFRGHDAIKAFFGHTFEGMKWLVQMNNITNVNLGADGKTATTSTGLIEMAQPKEGDQVQLIGRYDDELALTDAGWRFTKRMFTLYRFRTVP
jgi:ketosteroid isomerase-like protein